MGAGILHTSPTEMSMYFSERFRSVSADGISETRLRRCTLRTDGFISVEGPYAGWGEFTSHPLHFEGNRLEFNYSTSGGGSILVELEDESGNPIPGLTLDDCDEIFGDKIEGQVRWNGAADLGDLSNRPIRLRVRIRDAHLYAFQFVE